jgi:hypothetical protein
VSKVREIVKSLPETVEGIVELLVSKDVTGKPGRVSCCPLANYIKAEVGGLVEVQVEGTTVYYMDAEGNEHSCWMPSAVGRFVYEVDSGSGRWWESDLWKVIDEEERQAWFEWMVEQPWDFLEMHDGDAWINTPLEQGPVLSIPVVPFAHYRR